MRLELIIDGLNIWVAAAADIDAAEQLIEPERGLNYFYLS
jgi:hypothetical protein